MKQVRWSALDQGQRELALSRAPSTSSQQLVSGVAQIIRRVREGGDGAVKALTAELDKVEDLQLAT